MIETVKKIWFCDPFPQLKYITVLDAFWCRFYCFPSPLAGILETPYNSHETASLSRYSYRSHLLIQVPKAFSTPFFKGIGFFECELKSGSIFR